MNLKDKTVVITGATGGIGREIVSKLSGEEAKLILISNSESELQNLCKKTNNSSYFVCDLNNQEETEMVAKKVASEYEVIDVLINAAGIGIYKSIEDATIDDWNSSMNIGVTSVFIFSKLLLKKMENSKEALVLNIGSGAGVIPMAGRSLYCSTKFALRGLTLSLAEEFKRVGNPKFCLITLGSTLTSFGPLSLEDKKEEMEKGKAYFTPDWVGKKLVEIIQDDSRDNEYTLYPGEYGLGSWQKPEAL